MSFPRLCEILSAAVKKNEKGYYSHFITTALSELAFVVVGTSPSQYSYIRYQHSVCFEILHVVMTLKTHKPLCLGINVVFELEIYSISLTCFYVASLRFTAALRWFGRKYQAIQTAVGVIAVLCMWCSWSPLWTQGFVYIEMMWISCR